MTLPLESDDTCAVCGTVSHQTHLLSTTWFGASDLDGRPPQLKRSTMPWWVHRCPECGYRASDIAKAPPTAGETVRSEAYQEQLSDSRMPDLARSFLCAALIAETDKGLASGGVVTNCLRAAWACDDAKSADAAIQCRLRAAAALEALHKCGGRYAHGERSGDYVLLADLYRRAGRFDDAGVAASVGLRKAGSTFFRRLMELQLRLIAAADTTAHVCDDNGRRRELSPGAGRTRRRP